jgi:rare lipoprotein A
MSNQRNMITKLKISAALLSTVFSLLPLPAMARQCGQASWYGPGLYGNRTANGEVFRPGTLTAAHPSLALGTWVRVVNQDNGRVADVRINDRGPYVGGRIIDIAHGAAKQLGLTESGLARVCVTRI